MKNVNWWKIGIVAAIAVALFWGGCKYDQWKTKKSVGTVKTVTHDSLVYRDTGRIVPFRVDHYAKGKDGKPYPVHDTVPGVPEIIIEPTDTAAILARYNETAYYHHQVDTGRWKITVDESVTQNRIKDWSLKAVSSDTTTKTTTIIQPPKNFVAYFTFSTMGNFNNPLYAQSLGLALKLPNDKVYQVAIVRAGNHRPMVQATYLAPLRNPFRKRK